MQHTSIESIFSDKSIKPKQKTEMIASWLANQSLPVDELLAFASSQKDPIKATCIEALEFVTKENPAFADEMVLDFAIRSLQEKAPRIKWESAKVIGNIATQFPSLASKAIPNLLVNAKFDGTVVRWSSAFALGEILKLKLKNHAELLQTIEKLRDEETKTSIQKIYQAAIKKVSTKSKQ